MMTLRPVEATVRLKQVVGLVEDVMTSSLHGDSCKSVHCVVGCD